MLYRGKNLLSTHSKRIIYFAQIQSHLTYGMAVWGSMLSGHQLKELQTIQNKCIRQIDLRLSLQDVYKKYNILKIKSHLIKLENTKLWHKLHLDKLPLQLKQNMLHDEKKKSLTKNHSYNTRNKSLSNVPLAINNKYHRSFLVTGVVDYNTLEITIRNSKNLCTFTHRCKASLIKEQ